MLEKTGQYLNRGTVGIDTTPLAQLPAKLNQIKGLITISQEKAEDTLHDW
jgi:hypothetical protein